MVLKQGRQFELFSSSAGLNSYISYYNVVFPAGDMFPAQYTLMPNACGTLSLAFDANAVRAELWGASVAPVLLGSEPNRYRALLLIQLSPYGLYQITRYHQAQLAGKRLSLAAIDSELFCLLSQAFAAAKSTQELVNACEKVLYRRMEKPVVSDALRLAATAITESRGQIQVKEAAGRAGYSERQLNRLFLAQIGMNVKHYARLTRFHSVVRHMQQSPCPFAALSQQAGYFDQAHLDKDFKSITGVSPQVYLKTMSHFYYDAREEDDTISSQEE